MKHLFTLSCEISSPYDIAVRIDRDLTGEKLADLDAGEKVAVFNRGTSMVIGVDSPCAATCSIANNSAFLLGGGFS
jgi:hypothetical protein